MTKQKIPIIIHQEDSGAFVVIDDPLKKTDNDELQDDIAVLKSRLKGCMTSEMEE